MQREGSPLDYIYCRISYKLRKLQLELLKAANNFKKHGILSLYLYASLNILINNINRWIKITQLMQTNSLPNSQTWKLIFIFYFLALCTIEL